MEQILDKIGKSQQLDKVAVVIWGGQSFNTILEVTESFADMLDMSREQLVGAPVTDITPKIYADDSAWAGDQLKNTDGPFCFYKCYENMNGDHVPVKLTALKVVGQTEEKFITVVEVIDRLPFPEIGQQPYQKRGRNVVPFACSMTKPKERQESQ
jgi:hypothetical protein